MVFLVVFTASVSVSAATVSYGSLAAPGVYYGSGNPNTGFTVLTEGNLELGLGAIIRYVGPAEQNGNVYKVQYGPTEVPGKVGSRWGVPFSINTQAGGGSMVLSDYNYMVSFNNLTKATSVSFNPMLLPDNSYWGPGGETMIPDLGNQSGVQNSEAPSFLFLSTLLQFDPMDPDLYRIDLIATPVNGGQALTNSIFIDTVPEPSTYALMGAGLFGLLAAHRRRRKQKVS